MLNRLLASIVTTGTLTAIAPDGRSTRFGHGEPKIAMRFHDRRGMLELGANPELKLGELYMDGRLVVERGSIYDFLHQGPRTTNRLLYPVLEKG